MILYRELSQSIIYLQAELKDQEGWIKFHFYESYSDISALLKES